MQGRYCEWVRKRNDFGLYQFLNANCNASEILSFCNMIDFYKEMRFMKVSMFVIVLSSVVAVFSAAAAGAGLFIKEDGKPYP